MAHPSSVKAQLQAAVAALPDVVTLEEAEALLRARLGAAALPGAPRYGFSALSSRRTEGDVLIRRIREADAPSLVRLMDELGYSMPEALARQKLSELAASALDAAWVAELRRGQDVVGLVSAHRTWLLHRTGALGRITSLVVSPSHRQRGIGRLLMQTAEAYLWEHGCERIELTSGTHRKDAHAFYLSLGYSAQSTRFVKTMSPPA